MRVLRVYYTKQFTSGLLNGLISHQSVSFTSQQDADRFAKIMQRGTEHKDAITRSRFTVVEIAYQNYVRDYGLWRNV